MASGGGESTLFVDALSGPDGTAEPRSPFVRPDVFADPTAVPDRPPTAPASLPVPLPAASGAPGPLPGPPVGARGTVSSARPAVPVAPRPPAAATPRAVAPAAPAFPRPSAAPTRVQMPRAAPGGRQIAQPGRRTGPMPPPGWRTSPTGGAPAAMPARAGMDQLRTQLRQQALADRARARPSARKKKSGGVVGLLLFLFLFLLGSGVLRQLVALIQQYLHR